MKKLIKNLALEIKEWPVDKSLPLRQANDNSLYVSAEHTNGRYTNYLDIFVSKSENPIDDVTFAQWEAERARIAAMEYISAVSQEQANAEAEREKVSAFLETAVNPWYEQEMRDKVAKDLFVRWTSSKSKGAFASVAFDCADAFMAERAKRLKP